MVSNFLLSKFVKNHKNINNKKVREDYGLLSGSVGLIVNLILFLIEIIIGIVTNSIAVMADAFHNLADVTSSIITLVSFRLSNKPGDKEHPFGHGRFEYISAMTVSFIIIFVGIEFIKTSFDRVLHPSSVKFSLISFIIICIAIPLKLWLGTFNKYLGKCIKSSTLKAAGADALNDVVILSGVILSLLVSKFTHLSVDGYVGLIVAGFIVWSGVSLVKETLNPLLGQAPDPELVTEIERNALKYKYITGTHDLIIHNYGPGRIFASMHAEVPCNVQITKLHEVIDIAEKEISQKLNIELVMHMDPISNDSEEIKEAKKEVISITSKIKEVKSLHDFRIVGDGEYKNILFDIVIAYGKEIDDKRISDIKSTIDIELKKIHPSYNTVITVDRLYV